MAMKKGAGGEPQEYDKDTGRYGSGNAPKMSDMSRKKKREKHGQNKPSRVRRSYDIEASAYKIGQVYQANGIDEATRCFREMLKNGEINTALRTGSQDKHIVGTHNYNQEITAGRRPSILIADPEELFKKYAGTGDIGFDKLRRWDKRENCYESIEADRVIGFYVNGRENVEEETRIFSIRYSNSGYHIVPENPRKER